MKRLLFAVSLTFLCFPLFSQSNTDGLINHPGDIAFVALSTSSQDGYAFVFIDDCPAGTSIKFIDEEWNGTAFTSATSEGENTWTNNTGSTISKGTVIIIQNADDNPSPIISANIGLVTESDLGFNIANGDQIFAILGTRAAPTVFLAMIGSTTSPAPQTLSGTGLTVGTNAVEINSEAIYSGSTICNSNTSTCLQMINNNGNWTPVGGGTTFSASVPSAFTGSVFVSAAPELDVKNAGGGSDIADGSTTISTALGTDFGSRCVNGGTRRITFRAVNTGTSTLTFGADALAISNTTDFTIVNDIVNNGTLAPNVLDSFAIVFDPASAGTKDCTVTIRSDDADEDPYTFSIQGIGVAAPTTAAAGPDQAICGTMATLTGNNPTVGTGTWSEVTGDGNGSFANANVNNTTFTGTAGVSYTLRWTITNAPCTSSSDDIVINLVDNPTAAAAGPDQVVCGNNTTLAANTPAVGTGVWTEVAGDGNGVFGNTGSPTSSFMGSEGVTYTLRWTVSNSPCPISTDDVTVELINDAINVFVSPASVIEDGPNDFVYTFTRNCTENAVTMTYNLGGTANFFNDYTASGSGTISVSGGSIDFPVGEAVATVTIDPTVDVKPEQDETLIFTIEPGTGYSVGAQNSATGTITDDDSATISISDVSMSEGNAGTVNFCFDVTISTLPEENISMTAITADGTAQSGGVGVGSNDYVSKSETVEFNSDFPSPQTFCVTVNGDNVVELDENFFVNLTNLNANGQNVTFADNQGEGTILNDDQCVLSFILLPFGNTEGNSGTTSYFFAYNKSNPVDVGFTYRLFHSDGSATTADNDYSSGTQVVSTSGNAGNFGLNVFRIIGDNRVEPDEFFNLRFSEDNFKGRNIIFAGGAPFLETTVNILNDDIDWGDAPDSYLTLDASGGPSHGGSDLKLGTTNDGEADGQPSANADGDGAEDDGVTFTSTLIAGNSATVDVTASSAALLSAWVDFDQSGTFDSPAEQVFTDVAVATGVNNLNFAVPTTAVQGNTFARFRLSSVGGLSPTGAAPDGEVEDYQVAITAAQFSIDDPMVLEGDAGTANLSFTVSRSTNASDCSVGYAVTGGTATSGDDYQSPVSGTVNFAAGGALAHTVNVAVNGDMVVELDETVEMTLSAPVNGTIADGDGTGTIKNDDSATVTMSNPFITEGDAGSLILTFNVNTDKPVDVPVNFDFATSDGTATLADNDYQANSGNTSIPVGGFVQYIQVLENGDCQIEPDEFFNMTLGNLTAMGRDVTFAGGGGTLGSTGTINNDDALPEIYVPASFSQPTDPGQCSATVTVPLASTASICGSGTLDLRYRPVDASNNPIGPWSAWVPSANNTQVFAVGRHQVEWRITDGSGSNVGNFFFNVVDDENPTVNCMPSTAYLDANGNASITPTDVYAGGNDNCSPVTLVSVSPDNFDCGDLGPNTVTLTAVDGSGNPGSCTATVTVADGTAPVAACQDISIDLDENGMASIVPSDVDGGTSDNCGFTLSLDDMDFDCGDIPSATVTLTATDGSNNGHSCTATVTVNDVTPPTVLCMDATVQLDASGNVGITPATIFAGSADNCGFIGLYPLAQTEFDCDDIGPNIVTLNVFDGNGNDGSCTATVTVVDDQPAVVACNDLSLELDNMGQASITPADLFDAANSTDNCGTFNLTGLSQGDFTCLDEGTNTVTLYVEDAGGNVSTCVGTVTIDEFLAIVSVDHTDATCQNTGDGTISIVATAPYGQLLYSVDGGATWQATGGFEFLSPGTYDIVVQVFGIPSTCVKTATETVGVDPNGTGVTWYQDHDNDGYSNGNTLTQCERPNGFYLPGELIATSGDCNDHNPNAFPGQTWWKDYDGDGYGDGTSFVNCSQPAGLYPASGLTSTTGDCDDGDPAVNPGAIEICNGIDDDCDGEVDEGVAGGLTWTGNVLFTNQAQVDAWLACYSVIDGNLTVQNSGVVDLSNLVNLTGVTGNVYIKSTGLAGMAGLDNLATIGGFLKIQFNHSLATLDGLDAVTSVGGLLNVYRNTNLVDCCAIHGLLDTPGAIGGSVLVALNDTGCDSVAEVETACAGSSPLVAPPSSGQSTAAVSDAFELNVSPNPNDGHFVVSFSGTESAGQLRLMDATGKVFWSGVSAGGQQSIGIGPQYAIPTGLYFLVYTNKEESISKKVVVR